MKPLISNEFQGLGLIILDTNVVSEPAKPRPNLGVVRWLDRQKTETIFFTSTALAELLVGVERLPLGKRRQRLAEELETLVTRLFGNRILPFDETAARTYARLSEQVRSRGFMISLGDGQIAAIASVHGFTVATRDVEPFQAAGIPVLNPWEL